MNYPKSIVSNQKEEFFIIQRVNKAESLDQTLDFWHCRIRQRGRLNEEFMHMRNVLKMPRADPFTANSNIDNFTMYYPSILEFKESDVSPGKFEVKQGKIIEFISPDQGLF